MSDVMSVARPNPKFVAWLNSQTPTIQQDLASKWTNSATDPTIAQDSNVGTYARLKSVMDYAVSTYGYAY